MGFSLARPATTAGYPLYAASIVRILREARENASSPNSSEALSSAAASGPSGSRGFQNRSAPSIWQPIFCKREKVRSSPGISTIRSGPQSSARLPHHSMESFADRFSIVFAFETLSVQRDFADNRRLPPTPPAGELCWDELHFAAALFPRFSRRFFALLSRRSQCWQLRPAH